MRGQSVSWPRVECEVSNNPKYQRSYETSEIKMAKRKPQKGGENIKSTPEDLVKVPCDVLRRNRGQPTGSKTAAEEGEDWTNTSWEARINTIENSINSLVRMIWILGPEY